MKLKRLPSDFQVEELIAVTPGSGPFALYRLTKEALGTLEALVAVEQKWNLPRHRLSFAGLKDKHASTIQYVTIQHGPGRGFSQSNLQLAYLGQLSRPLHASDIVANRFQIVIRDLNETEVGAITASLSEIGSTGLPNYFDSQRFGSVGESGEFIARPWCLGNFERAVWLALVDANVHDRPRDRAEKEAIRSRWGDWQSCLRELGPSVRRDVVAHLAQQPHDFRRAITVFPHAWRSLWLAAFQSHLWNRILARLISSEIPAAHRFERAVGVDRLPLFTQVGESRLAKLQSMVLPLPSARLHLDAGELQGHYDQVLAEEGMELRQVRVKYPRDTFFSKGDRLAVVRPGDFQHEFASDDLYAGQQKLTLSFILPRGSYATILVKRLVGDVPGMADESETGLE